MAISVRKSFKKKNNLVSDINVTPLIDVMLVLLVIFMVTSPMMVSGVKVDLPETTSSPLSEPEEPLTITIDKDDKVYIMDTLIGTSALSSKLRAITKEKYDTRIFIRGDKSVSYGKIVDVIAEINAAGLFKVALITKIKTNEK